MIWQLCTAAFARSSHLNCSLQFRLRRCFGIVCVFFLWVGLLFSGIVSDMRETSPRKLWEAFSACPPHAAGFFCVTIPTFPRLNEAASLTGAFFSVTFLVRLGPVFLHFCVREGKRAREDAGNTTMQTQACDGRHRRVSRLPLLFSTSTDYGCVLQPNSFTKHKEGGPKQLQAAAFPTTTTRSDGVNAEKCSSASGLPGWRSTLNAGAPSASVGEVFERRQAAERGALYRIPDGESRKST